MTRVDAIADAAEEAKKLGVCPMSRVSGYYSEHWSVDEICSWFACTECLATPRDFGYDMDIWPNLDDLPEVSSCAQQLDNRRNSDQLDIPF